MEKEKDRKKIINVDLDDEDEVVDDDDDTNDSNSENCNAQSENSSSSASSKKNRKMSRALKGILTNNSTKFMSNFDPELSNREKRKLTRKIHTEGKKYNEVNGGSGTTEKDVCDCLNEECPGCHFPCPKCRSCKCGIECRLGNEEEESKYWMNEKEQCTICRQGIGGLGHFTRECVEDFRKEGREEEIMAVDGRREEYLKKINTYKREKIIVK